MSTFTKNRRLTLRVLTLLVSCAALAWSATHANAAEWHYQWGSTPVITPTGGTHAYGNCPYALPAGVPAQGALVGVHFNHTWVELKNWSTNLGYSPEAMSYHLCTKNQGTSTWYSSPFFQLWSVARPTDPTKTRYDATSPDYACPPENPYIVGAFCQTRASW